MLNVSVLRSCTNEMFRYHKLPTINKNVPSIVRFKKDENAALRMMEFSIAYLIVGMDCYLLVSSATMEIHSLMMDALRLVK
jgi:hypothetical protein